MIKDFERVYVLDCGMRQSTLYDVQKDSVEVINHTDVLNLANTLPQGSLLVCEYAHLGCPRKPKSLAQPFDGNDLLKLYSELKQNNITLKLFPQQLTSRAVNLSRLEKSDENDPKSIYQLLVKHPEISLMNPPQTFELSNIRQESYDWVNETNLTLNYSRFTKYDEEYALFMFLKNNAQEMYENMSDLCKDVFGFDTYKTSNKNKGFNKGDVNLNKLAKNRIYSIMCQVIKYDGSPMLRKYTGKPAGWKFVKRYALKQTPFHLKGGVARSNLVFHGMRNWVAKKMAEELNVPLKTIKKKRRGGYTTEDDKYIEPFNDVENALLVKYRAQFRKAMKELFTIIKDIQTQRGLHRHS